MATNALGEAGQSRRILMNNNPTPYVLGPEDGEAFWGLDNSLWSLKATAEQTGGRFSLIEEVAPRGEGTPLHVHREDDETFYVLEGESTFYLDSDQPIPAPAGSFVHIPGGGTRLQGRLRNRTVPYHHHLAARTLLPCHKRACTVTDPSARANARQGEGHGRCARVRGRGTWSSTRLSGLKPSVSSMGA